MVMAEIYNSPQSVPPRGRLQNRKGVTPNDTDTGRTGRD